MSSTNFFFIFIPILSVILLAVNFILAPHKPNKEKKTPFECGYHSFLSQTRTEFSFSFFLYAILFLVFDMEIVMTYPFSTSMAVNETYGLTVLIIFASLITIGFVYELGIGALKIETKENSYDSFINKQNIVKKTSTILPSSIIFYLQKYKAPITLCETSR
jgi:NADH-ubiquinone oxidoreductase chain 3